MKQNFDKNTKVRSFKSRDKVLALFPIPGRPLQARYYGPYTVEKKASDLNYIITITYYHPFLKHSYHSTEN